MTLGLRSVELVLLAPLGYLFVSVFAGFVEAMAIDGDNLSVGFGGFDHSVEQGR